MCDRLVISKANEKWGKYCKVRFLIYDANKIYFYRANSLKVQGNPNSAKRQENILVTLY